MPATRNGRRATREIINNNVGDVPTEDIDAMFVPQLRALCSRRNLPQTGRRDTLIARLRNTPVTEKETNATNKDGGSEFNDVQLQQIKSLVTATLENSVQEIAKSAANAAVKAMAQQNPKNLSYGGDGKSAKDDKEKDSTNDQDFSNDDDVRFTGKTTRKNSFLLGGFQDVPSAYTRDIQLGEFFDISKLLPKNQFRAESDEPLMLTLENSVIKVSKAASLRTNIADIEQWTTAFCTYMGIFTDKFPNRSQELLSYMNTIRHAAQFHQGLGWSIYDHKFRQKAAINKATNWAAIDSQLWLMIFTVAPSVLKDEFPLFSNGPSSVSSSHRAEIQRTGTCHNFNRKDSCFRNPCRYRHVCNRCQGSHPGTSCPIIQSRDDAPRTSSNDGQTKSKSSKSRH